MDASQFGSKHARDGEDASNYWRNDSMNVDEHETSPTSVSGPAYDDYCSDEDEQTAWEYARECGFCVDYLSEDPLQLCASSTLPWSTARDFDDPKGATPLEKLYPQDAHNERWTADKEALLFIQKAIVFDEDREPLCGMPDVEPRKSLKIELPLLLSDHEADMKVFQQRVPEVQLRDIHPPMEHVDVEKDEGMEWPQRLLRLPVVLMRKIQAERLQFPRDTAKYLHDLMKGGEDVQSFDELYSQIGIYTKKAKARLAPISPPLLPMLSPELPSFDPSSETGELPLLSDGNDLTIDEVDAIDKQLMQRDRILASHVDSNDEDHLMDTDDLTQLYTPLQSDLASLGTPPRQKRKTIDMKVEPPLIPSDGSLTSSKKRKTVSFAEELYTVMPTFEPPPSQSVGQLDSGSEASLEAFFKDVIEPMALEADRHAEQEQLQAADSLQRITVPVMDFTLAAPPWKSHDRAVSMKARAANSADAWDEFRAAFTADLKHIVVYGTWKISGKLERQLQPFPFDAALGKVPIEAPIDDSRYMAKIMSDMSLEDLVQSDDLVWKPDGLRIARRHKYEYDEELEIEEYPASEDGLERDVRLLNGGLPQGNRSHARAAVSLAESPKHAGLDDFAMAIDTTPQNLREITTTSHRLDEPFFGGGFTTASSLHAFMNNMGQQTTTNGGLREQLTQHAMPTKTRNDERTHAVDTDPGAKGLVEEPARPTQPLILPMLPKRLQARSVILSVALLQTHRRVLKTVFKDLYPVAYHIERDFGVLPDCPEADILLAPGTGLVFTNLQKIKQKPLPGQEIKLRGIRERLVKLSTRYELLVVLVGDAIIQANDVFDRRDAEGMNDFVTFCSHLEVNVQVTYVPEGEEAMAAWAASTIYNHGSAGPEPPLLQEETMWEQTLRRIGLNAYAAQSVLANLKPLASSSHPTSPDETAGTNRGLSIFLRMSSEQRVVKFGELLGGHHVLQHVNEMLAQEW